MAGYYDYGYAPPALGFVQPEPYPPTIVLPPRRRIIPVPGPEPYQYPPLPVDLPLQRPQVVDYRQGAAGYNSGMYDDDYYGTHPRWPGPRPPYIDRQQLVPAVTPVNIEHQLVGATRPKPKRQVKVSDSYQEDDDDVNDYRGKKVKKPQAKWREVSVKEYREPAVQPEPQYIRYPGVPRPLPPGPPPVDYYSDVIPYYPGYTAGYGPHVQPMYRRY